MTSENNDLAKSKSKHVCCVPFWRVGRLSFPSEKYIWKATLVFQKPNKLNRYIYIYI